MSHFFKHYFNDTSGAVTVDWVVLTAAIVGIGIMATVSIATGASALGGNVEVFLSTDTRFFQND